jgi:hypothetical protein
MALGLAAGLALGEPAAQTAATQATSSPTGDPTGSTETGTIATGTTATGTTATQTTTTGETQTQTGTTSTTRTHTTPGGPSSQGLPPATAAAAVGTGVGSARHQPAASKWREARLSCKAHPPHAAPLLGVRSATTDHDRRWLTWTIVAITSAAAAVAFVAIVRRRRVARPAGSRKTALELVSATVAIAGTLAGLASAFIPGVGVRERPAPEVTMTVREVHARITRGDYEAKTERETHPPVRLSSRRLLSAKRAKAVADQTKDGRALAAAYETDLDRLEIGDVAWLELHFSGYRGKPLTLQWAMFLPGAGGALIPETEDATDVAVDDGGDESSQFIPIWFGLPKLAKFRAEFRVLEGSQVRQMATTDPMRGAEYRYACPKKAA